VPDTAEAISGKKWWQEACIEFENRRWNYGKFLRKSFSMVRKAISPE
jgi:hypothetical protein